MISNLDARKCIGCRKCADICLWDLPRMKAPDHHYLWLVCSFQGRGRHSTHRIRSRPCEEIL